MKTMSAQARDSQAEATSAALIDELIPGILNDVTVAHVTTKLSTMDIDNLASVSRAWRDAIRSRQVYDARVRSNSRETVVIVDTSTEVHVVAPKLYAGEYLQMLTFATLYAPGLPRVALPPQTCLALPPLISEHYNAREFAPRTGVVISGEECSCLLSKYDHTVKRVTLDGKLYVLWGLNAKLQVLDVAGHRKWKQCADMLKPRLVGFANGAVAGKLFVSGNRDYKSFGSRLQIHFDVNGKKPDPLEVYDPLKDEWTVVEPVGTPEERVFVAEDRLYSMSPCGIHIYDFHANSWGDLHPFPFAAEPVEMCLCDAKLLAVVKLPNGRTKEFRLQVHSRGLGSQNSKIVWEEFVVSRSYYDPDFVGGIIQL